MWNDYAKFHDLHVRFTDNEYDYREEMQKMFPRSPKGALDLMKYFAASCLNYSDEARCKVGKTQFNIVMGPNWTSANSNWLARIKQMGIDPDGGYDGNDAKLILLDVSIGFMRKAAPGMTGFVPLFSAWQKEVCNLAQRIYPSGALRDVISALCHRTLETGKVSLADFERSTIKPNRETEQYRVKGMPSYSPEEGTKAFLENCKNMAEAKHDDILDAYCKTGEEMFKETQSANDIILTKMLQEQFDYAEFFVVRRGVAFFKTNRSVFARNGETCFRMGELVFNVHTARKHLNKFLSEMNKPGAVLRRETTIKETETMTKTNSFLNTVKGIFGNVVRMQRGRVAVHAAKRIIFSAFPIKWGVLARLTGKAKKIEDHPLTDVAVALLAHGAANALLDDPAKREKYLKYTEEMVAAAVAHAGFKMVPVEELLDKVLKGALDSEAVQKVKAVLQDAEK